MKNSLRLCFAVGVAALPLMVVAQANPVNGAAVASDPDADQGRPLRIGNVYVRPSLAVRLGYDDNVTQAPGTTGQPKIASATQIITAGLTGDIEYKGDRYALDYQGALTQFSDSSKDNMADNALTLQGNNVFTARNALLWQAGLRDAYDPRGSVEGEQSTGRNSSEPSHYQAYRYGGTYSYGATGAEGRLEFDAFQTTKSYLNNRTDTTTSDLDTTELAGRFFWRVAPKTSAVLDVRHAVYDYTASTALLDSNATQIFVGADWNATAATTGSFRIGQSARSYSDPLRASFSGLAWTAAVSWTPLTYSVIDFSTSKDLSDTANGQAAVVGSYIVSTSYGVNWKHDWMTYLHSVAKVSLQDQDYTSIDRKDRTQTVMLGAYYDFRKWMSLGLEVTQSSRSSNVAVNAFDRMQTSFVAQAKF